MHKLFYVRGMVVLSLFLLAFACGGQAKAESYVNLVNTLIARGHFELQIEQLLLAKVNSYRRGRGVQVLQQETEMAFASRAHAEDMAIHGRLGHVASNGMDFDSRMRALRNGALVLPAMAENAAVAPAKGDASHVAEVLFSAWLHSEGHRLTMVSRDYIKVSTGVTIVNGKAWADQIFAGPAVSTNIMRAQ